MFRSSGQNIQLRSSFVSAGCSSSLCIPGGVKGAAELDRFPPERVGSEYNALKALCVCVTVCLHRSEEDSEGNRDICSEILQMKALERLTSTVSVCLKITQIQNLLIKSKKSIVLTSSLQQVQSELAAALARKTRKACKYEL